MNLASWKYEAIKLPQRLPPAQTGRLMGGVRHPGGREKKRVQGAKREREEEKNGRLTKRIEPFSRATGVGSVLTMIELKYQLVMRPPRLEVRSGLREHCPTISHPPAVCFDCLPA